MAEPKHLTKRQLAAVVRKLERHRGAIRKHCDALSELQNEVTTLVDSADEACQSLQAAIDRLSEYA